MPLLDEIPRTPGKLGRLAQRRVGERFQVAYIHDYMTAAIPPPIYPVDVSGGITQWGMLGNSTAGDCGEAGQLHYQMSVGAAYGQIPAFTENQALAEYFAYTGGQDTGVVLADFLLWLYRKGEILGFAPVDIRNRAQADSLMAIFHGLYVGVSLTDADQQAFSAGQPWSGDNPDPNLGHCILQVGASTGPDLYVTWGALQQATRQWTAACRDEAWVIVTTQEQTSNLNMDALYADLDVLGGVHGAPNPPTPGPTPSRCNPLGWMRGIFGSGGG